MRLLKKCPGQTGGKAVMNLIMRRSGLFPPFDEGILTSKYTVNSEFPEGDFRKNDFAGDRLARAVKRVEQIETDIAESGLTLPQAALRFALAHTAVRTIIAGIRSVQQTEANGAASDLPPLTPELLSEQHERAWLRGFWYSGKYYLCQVMVWLIDA
jgi:aryl-alcohol dehydrogenase-like predicted oxidoreductase